MSCAVRNHRGDESGSFTEHYEALARQYSAELSFSNELWPVK